MGTRCYNILKPIDKDQMTVTAKNIQKDANNNPEKSPGLTTRSIPGQRKVQKQKNISQKPNKTTDKEYERSNLTFIQKNNKEANDSELIEQCLSKHFFMRSLEHKNRIEIVKEMSLCSIPANTLIFKQGGIGTYFYILKQGTVEFTNNVGDTKLYKVGDSFGELALLHSAPRSHNAKAVNDCLVWVLRGNNFKKIVAHITRLNYEECKSFVESVPILSVVDHTQKSLLCSSLYKENFEEGQYIVKQGADAHCLYIVKEGEVICSLNGNVVRTLKKGDNFGERSILVDSTRSMDVIAKTNCACYSLSKASLNTILGDNYRNILYMNFIKSSFKKSKHLNKFNLYLLNKTLTTFKVANLHKNDTIFKSGYHKASKLVVVIDGSLINKQTSQIVAQRGSIVFEDEIITPNNKDTINYDIIANPDCLIAQADMKDFTQVLGGDIIKVMKLHTILDSLVQVRILKYIPNQKLEHLAEVVCEETFQENENIITEGEEGKKFYIVKQGQVAIYVKGKYMRTLNEKEYFGERALFFHEKRSATIKSVGTSVVFSVSQEEFMNIIENTMKEYLMTRLYLQDNTVELDNLDFCAQLGQGNFGTVALVKNRKNNFNYAIKIISRQQIDNEGLHHNLELEKNILLQIDHPFIVKLVKTLKDVKHLYFLMEYIKGKELFDVIRDIGLLDKPQTQFYGASLMLAVDYLHERRFIYRDIKPENVIVIQNGFIKLIDFGTAKIITDRTSTMIGTPHYMAPEVILGEGYSFQVDMWSIGICMYEFMCGAVPFGENFEDPYDVYLSIMNE